MLQRNIAVKVLRPEFANHAETLARFQAEARHAGALTHPCIAQIYDFGHADPPGTPYLVMELVNGPSLADVLAAEPVSVTYALDVIAQAASGLAAAHRAGLVHRDVKPGNILLGPDGQVKLTDFGIAHAVGSAPVTDPGLVMGTTQYLAPERIAGGSGSPASDLYSLGIVLHESLTGVPPFDGTPAEVMAAHMYFPLPPLPSGTPAEVEELVARLTAKDPTVRLSDAGDLAAIARRLHAAAAVGQSIPGQFATSRALHEPAGETAAAGPGSTALAAGPQSAHDERMRAVVEGCLDILVRHPSGPQGFSGAPGPHGHGIPSGAHGPSLPPRQRAAKPGFVRDHRAVFVVTLALLAVIGLAGWLLAGGGMHKTSPLADRSGPGPTHAPTQSPARPTPTASASPSPSASASAKSGQQAKHRTTQSASTAGTSTSGSSGSGSTTTSGTGTSGTTGSGSGTTGSGSGSGGAPAPEPTSGSGGSTGGGGSGGGGSGGGGTCLLGLACLPIGVGL